MRVTHANHPRSSAMTDRVLDPRPSLAGRAGRSLLRALGVHPDDREAESLDLAGRSALCIATNHGVLDVGVPTGVFASELTVPYYAFLDAGMRVDIASCAGGLVPVEPLSMKPSLRTRDDDRLLADDELRRKLVDSLGIAELDFARYDLVYFAGGWGAAFDLGQSELLGTRVSEASAAGRVIGGICHGPLGLLRARRRDGELLVKDRRITAVTDRQIHQLGVSITPLHPESALRAAGARFECRHHRFRDFLANHYVADGDLVTGQNQNAGPMVARLMMRRVLTKPAVAPRSPGSAIH
jgi:putative intracellular protease/amidase